MLRTIKSIHTIIWAIMAFACSYVLYAGIFRIVNFWLWFCIVLILFEGLVLLINKGVCPLTPMARKYTLDRKDNFDIYLPEWLAKYNKLIFGMIFTTGLILVLLHVLL